MSNEVGRTVRIFFYTIFSSGAVLFTGLNFAFNLSSQSNTVAFVTNEVLLIFFTVLAFLGVNKGVKSIFSSFSELEENPGVLKINFYSQISILASLLTIIIFDVALVYLGYGFVAFFVGTFTFILFLFSLTVLEYVTKGAIAIHLLNNVSPGRAVIRSLRLIPRYVALEIYRHLFMSSGFIGRKISGSILSSKGFSEEVISQGVDIALSYATFYAALGNTARESIIASIRKTVSEPAETTFLNLGIFAVFLLSSLFLVIPIGLFFLILVLGWETLGELSVVLASIPFLTGIIFYLYIVTVPATAGEIALLRKIAK